MGKKKDQRMAEEEVRKISNVLPHQSGHLLPSDVLGSYTGHPIDDEVPVQDADDL